MSSSYRIVVSGPTLVLCPTIKQHFGLSAALVLQQLHYWLSQENEKYGVIDERGRQWIRNSYEQWREQIQVLAISTLRRAFDSLKAQGIILSRRSTEKSKFAGGNQVRYYSIDYDQLETIVGDLKQVSINRPRNFAEVKRTEGKDTSKENSPNKVVASISNNVSEKSFFKNLYTPPHHLLKMNRQPAQNEQTLYITKNTSEITSLFSDDKNPSQTNSEKINDQRVQPAMPAKRDNQNYAEEMISLWNEIVEEEQNKIALTTRRHQHLHAALKQFFKSDISEWEVFCCKIASSKFLMGEVKQFKANLDWAIRFEIIQRILEGGYSFGDRVVRYQSKGKKHVYKLNEFSSNSIGTSELPTQRVHTTEKGQAALIRKRLLSTLGDNIYQAWFKDTQIIFEDENNQQMATLYVENKFIADSIRTRYGDIVENFFQDIVVGKPGVEKMLSNTCLSHKTEQTSEACFEETDLIQDLSNDNVNVHESNDLSSVTDTVNEKEKTRDCIKQTEKQPKLTSSVVSPYLKETLTNFMRYRVCNSVRMKGRGVYKRKTRSLKLTLLQKVLEHNITANRINNSKEARCNKQLHNITALHHLSIIMQHKGSRLRGLKQTKSYMSLHMMQNSVMLNEPLTHLKASRIPIIPHPLLNKYVYMFDYTSKELKNLNKNLKYSTAFKARASPQ